MPLLMPKFELDKTFLYFRGALLVERGLWFSLKCLTMLVQYINFLFHYFNANWESSGSFDFNEMENQLSVLLEMECENQIMEQKQTRKFSRYELVF